MKNLFEHPLVPVASPEDARATCRALEPYLGDVTEGLVAVHVIEKAGGAPDKAGVEQRKEFAQETFEALRNCLDSDQDIVTEIHYGTDVAETIFGAADEHDATAIVITPRGGSRWIRLLTGDIALDIVTESDRPVVVLPDIGAAGEDVDENTDADQEGSGGGERT
jgi:nucleotide-binding universal stress UspA family protein